MSNRRPRSTEQLLDDGYAVDIGYYVRGGAEILHRDLGAFIGYTLLSGLISLAAALLPGIGGLLQVGLSGPLAAGPQIFAFKSCQGQERDFSDFFGGFRYWVPLLVTALMISCLGLLLMVPFFVVTIVQMLGVFAPLMREEIPAEQVPPELLVELIPWVIFLALSIFGVGLGLRLIYVFAYALIVDRKLDFWPAMELSRRVIGKRWLPLLGLLLVTDLINMMGAVFLLVGLLYTLPLTQCILAMAYEDIVGLEAESY